jgi:hypothetical protein
MRLAARLAILERRTPDRDVVTLFIPWRWQNLRDGEEWGDEWLGLPTDAECTQLETALAAEGLRVSFVTWQGDVETTLRFIRPHAGRDLAGMSRPRRVVRSPPPYKSYGCNPHHWFEPPDER